MTTHRPNYISFIVARRPRLSSSNETIWCNQHTLEAGVKLRSLFPPSPTPVQTQQTTQASILAHLAASPCTTGT
jgi:hypothetical protein